MSPQNSQPGDRRQKLRELLARRAAIRREIRILDQKIAVLSVSALRPRALLW
jgi:hypothetical protein